ncbi:MAG: beta-galactosidase [Chthoniobacteraceae bacterium]
MRIYACLCVLAALVDLSVAASPKVIEEIADFSDPQQWSAKLDDGISFEPAGSWTQLNAGKSASDTGKLRMIFLERRTPMALPESAIRLGVWIYADRFLDLSSLGLAIEDARGRQFDYTLTVPAKWQSGWQYLDTYPFDANEIGRLHPNVGIAKDGNAGLPVPPFKFKGLVATLKGNVEGRWLLGAVEADSRTLQSPDYYWALVRPGERYWMETTLMRSGESPYMLASFIAPDGGAADYSWEVRSGFQGGVVTSGSMRLNLLPGDAKAAAERISLGELPAGNYEVILSKRPLDPSKVKPREWNALGNGAAWGVAPGKTESRCLSVTNDAKGGGFTGWRQSVRISSPGTYRLKLAAQGGVIPAVRIIPLNRSNQESGPAQSFRSIVSGTWRIFETDVTLPNETDRVYVDLSAEGKGTAMFKGVSLFRNGVEFVDNGDASVADILERTRMRLSVVSSPIAAKGIFAKPFTTEVGKVLEIPEPTWARLPGVKTWQVKDTSRKVAGSGEVKMGAPIRWTPEAPGVYTYEATRSVEGLVMDRDERLLGGQTPEDAIGPKSFKEKDQVPKEQDLFGPGKNYFTWSMYEYHPEEPDFLVQCARWIKDGRTAGFDLFRIRVDWNFAEPLPQVYDFSVTDKLVKEVAAQGGRTVLELRFVAPQWMRPTPQLDSYGRADLWRHGKVSDTFSVWTPGMLEAVRRFTETVVTRYRNHPEVAGYHLWGMPGSLDWTSIDKPYLGQRTDYSAAALAKFNEWTHGKYSQPPMASQDWSRPDLSDEWCDWVAFRRHGLETFFIDSVLKPLRALDDRRSVIGYFGLDFSSHKLAESAREQNWRRHTGGCELYYQIPAEASRALNDTGRTWPMEVHLLTPVSAGLEAATFQISSPGGDGFHWNYYWRNNIPVGQWTPDREEGLTEYEHLWRPIWRELRDAELAPAPDIAGVTTWSTMQYGVRTFFPLRLGDYMTKTAAALYRDQLWPAWFSENASMDHLGRYKLIVVPPAAARVMPAQLADALERYVTEGGKIALFADSGKWVIEEPQNTDALVCRLGGVSTGENTNSSAMVLGNSGLPVGGKETQLRTVKPVSGLFRPDQPIVYNDSVKIPATKYSMEAAFEDGSPAVVTWQHGKGEVIYFAGVPAWDKCPGLAASLYQWAGGARKDGTTQPFIQLNHLKKGTVHYVILHRLPDSFRPQNAVLDRALLRQQPAVKAQWYLRDIPEGRWKITDMTSGPEAVVESTSGQLAKGLPVELFLAQTKVFKLEPVAGTSK